MQLVELKKKYHTSLSGLYPDAEIHSIFELVAEYALKFPRNALHINQSNELLQAQENQGLQILDRLKNGEPVQYILEITSFYELDFKVSPAVLIPRQETELLVHEVIKEFQNSKNISLLDLCTGSGCIAITLAKHLKEAQISAMDLSEQALRLAQLNATNYQLTIPLVQDDVLKPTASYDNYDVIVSNPPYVRQLEKTQMHRNVLDHEPHSALFVPDDDPLMFYRAIAEFGRKHLNSNGKVYLEINEAFGNETRKLFAEYGYKNLAIIKDLNGKDRILKGSY